MSLESVRAFLAIRAPDIAIVELEDSTATVALAAAGHGVEPAQIAKTLSLKVRDRNLLLVTRGDARLDPERAPHQSPAPGRTGRGAMGGRLPEWRLAQALFLLPHRSR